MNNVVDSRHAIIGDVGVMSSTYTNIYRWVPLHWKLKNEGSVLLSESLATNLALYRVKSSLCSVLTCNPLAINNISVKDMGN